MTAGNLVKTWTNAEEPAAAAAMSASFAVVAAAVALRGGELLSSTPAPSPPIDDDPDILKDDHDDHDARTTTATTTTTTTTTTGNTDVTTGSRRRITITDFSQLNKRWFQTPEPFRFSVGGMLGTICFYVLEVFVSHYLFLFSSSLPPFVDRNRDSISFFVSYMMQIVVQHLLNAWLVYGLHTIDTRQKYITTLAGQYGVYFTAVVGSTILNTWLRKQGMGKDHAFAATLILFGVINYSVIGWMIQSTNNESTTTTTTEKTKQHETKNTPIIQKKEQCNNKPEEDGSSVPLQKTDIDSIIPRGGWIRQRRSPLFQPMKSDSVFEKLHSVSQRDSSKEKPNNNNR